MSLNDVDVGTFKIIMDDVEYVRLYYGMPNRLRSEVGTTIWWSYMSTWFGATSIESVFRAGIIKLKDRR